MSDEDLQALKMANYHKCLSYEQRDWMYGDGCPIRQGAHGEMMQAADDAADRAAIAEMQRRKAAGL